MSDQEQAVETQVKNIQQKTGKSLPELEQMVRQSGLTKHSEIRAMLMQTLGLGHGDANTLVHVVLQSDGTRAAEAQGLTTAQVEDEIYSGAKAGLRPIHDRLMAQISAFGEFDIAPKKGYLSLRRKKQFAMIGPGSNTRVEVGLNIKNLPAHERLIEQPAGSMCNYKIKITDLAQVDSECFAWIRQAFENAG